MHTLLDERDKVEIESQIQKISNNSIVSKKAGNSIVAYDSAGNKPRGLRVFGKSTQDTIPGNQLLPNCRHETVTESGITYTNNGDGTYTLNGTCTAYVQFIDIASFVLPAGTYYVSGVDAQSQIRSTDGLTKLKEGTGTFVLDEEKEVKFRQVVLSDATYTNKHFSPMINKGTTSLPWEPYVGGIASPNPEYPQELESAGADGNIEVGVYGGNLLELKSDKLATNDGLNAAINNDGSITINGTPTREYAQCYNERLDLPIGEYYFTSDKITNMPYGQIQLKYLDSTVKYVLNGSFSIDNTIERVTFMIQADGNTNTINNYTLYPILCICSESIPYEQYKPKQTLAISTPNGLPGIPVTDASLATYTDADGNMLCADEVDFERGVYVQRIGSTVLDGSRSWNKHGYMTIEGENRFYCNSKIGQLQISDGINGIFSHFKTGNLEKSNGNAFVGKATIQLRWDAFEDATELRTWLSENPVEVRFILETPIETPLSAEELEAYKALTMNHPTTTILNDSNAHMEVEYIANTQNHIEQNYLTKEVFESLKTRISSIANNII